jgi:uracil-DNA glycosylase family 4
MIKPIYPPGAKILFVTGVPTERETISGKVLHPETNGGRMFDRLLTNCRLTRYDVATTSIAKDKAPGGRYSFFFDKPKTFSEPRPIMSKWIEDLKQEIRLHNPNIIVPLGDMATKILTNEDKLTEVRGYTMSSTLLPEKKILCTYDPYEVFNQQNLGFTTVMDFRKAVRNSDTPSMLADARNLISSPSYTQFVEYINWILHDHKDPVSLDIETTPSGHLAILGLAANPNLGMSFTFLRGGKALFSPEKEFQLWRLLARLFKEKTLIMHNGLFDMASMWYHLGILASGYTIDTMVAIHICWPETPRSLSYMSSICLDVPKWKHTAAEAKAMYNCEDCTNTYGGWEFMSKELEKGNHWETFNFEMKQVWPASMMQLQGVHVDKEIQKSLINSTKMEINYLEKELLQEIGRPINFRSSQQLQTLLYQDLKLPIQYKRRKRKTDPRKVTADEEALKKLARKTNNPVLEKIIKYKKLYKLISSFLEIEVSPESRTHTSYNITGAKLQFIKKGAVIEDDGQRQSFGRWSSSESIIIPYGSGNLQNIPPVARKMYADPPKVYVQADYKQAEAVVVSYEILDLPMIKLFKDSFGLTPEECKAKNLDIHKLTAARNFNIPIEKVTKELRDVGKTLRHAVAYSAGPKVVATKLGCSLSHAKVLLETHHNGCPQLRIWHKNIEQQLRQTRILTNLLGRKHKFLKALNEDTFRSAYSYIPQSTVGDLLNFALIRLYENYGEDLEIALQLHDAIYCLVEPSLVDWTCTVMRQCMLIPLTSSHGEKFYIDVDFKVGPSWGEMEDYTSTYTHKIPLEDIMK